MDQLETFADDPRAPPAEDLAYLLRRGRGGNVVILGRAALQQVADCAADDIGFISGLLEVGYDIVNMGFHFKLILHLLPCGG
ncbi:hypothetical protein SDC9_93201 [bioreactor metagenome]|uniref:Uncharacterized protein n=1 Tax=bioreactor metagenome TaxID=1076179 RepID=A0A645A181_9ZZZZ